MPPLKEPSVRSLLQSAGRVAATESGRSASERETSRSESTSTVIFGKVCQKVSSTRFTRRSASRYFDACSSTSGVSRSGVRIHTISEQMSTKSPAATAAAMPVHFRMRRHRGLRGFLRTAVASGASSGIGCGGCSAHPSAGILRKSVIRYGVSVDGLFIFFCRDCRHRGVGSRRGAP